MGFYPQSVRKLSSVLGASISQLLGGQGYGLLTLE